MTGIVTESSNHRIIESATPAPVRIAYVVYSEWRERQSGLSTYIRTLLNLFDREGFEAEIVEIPEFIPAHAASGTPPGDARAQHLGDGSAQPRPPGRWEERGPGEAKHPAAPPSFAGLRLALGYVRALLRDIRRLWMHRKELRGGIVMTNEFGCEVLPIALRCVVPAARIVAIGHTHPSVDARALHPVRRAVERLCYASVSDIVFNSVSLREQWRKKLGLRRIRGTVILHGLEELDPGIPVEYPERDDGTVDFVCVARFVAWKGHRQLLRAWKRAEERTKTPVRLILVGDGPTLEDNIAYARELGLAVADLCEPSTVHCPPSADVVFLGRRADGARYFNGGDVGLLLPVEPEAFGLVLLEMMSCSTPVVASRRGGLPEVVEDGGTGILVDPTDADDVASALCRLAEDPATRGRMGALARQRWEERFRVERMLNDYEAYFKDGKAGRP